MFGFCNFGIPVGQFWGITVRLHFTFFVYAFYRVMDYDNILYGIAAYSGLFFCILLHEFGHALAARWCDGEAEEILLWPLGGLAFVRPAWHPTAHLITTVAGPFVTLVLWLLFIALTNLILLATRLMPGLIEPMHAPYWFVWEMRYMNGYLLLFNLIPAFPMDGGRILRDSLWHRMSAESATKIAVTVGHVIAVGAVGYAIYSADLWWILLAAFILFQSLQEQQVVAFEAGGTYQFSLRERLSRGQRQRKFHSAVASRTAEDEAAAFHRCAACGRTERDPAGLDFRVCPDCTNGQEYCQDHLATHQHT